MKTAGFALIAALCLTSSVWASSARYSVTLAKPVTSTEDIVAGMTSFRCADTTCISVSEPYDASNVSTCRSLSRKVGDVVAYGDATHPFDADELARCNQKD